MAKFVFDTLTILGLLLAMIISLILSGGFALMDSFKPPFLFLRFGVAVIVGVYLARMSEVLNPKAPVPVAVDKSKLN